MAVVATVAAMALVTVGLGIFAILDGTRRSRRLKLKREALSDLPGDRSLEAVLASSRYDYAHFQGEDGYRIVDTVGPTTCLDSVPTRLDAHLWIVERSLGGSERSDQTGQGPGRPDSSEP